MQRIANTAKIFTLANQVFKESTYAIKWLQTPQLGLQGAIPMSLLETELGAHEVKTLLNQIRFGVYV